MKRLRITLADTLFLLFLALAVTLTGCAPTPSHDNDMQLLLGYMHDTCARGDLIVTRDSSSPHYFWSCRLGKRDDNLYPYESEPMILRGTGRGDVGPWGGTAGGIEDTDH